MRRSSASSAPNSARHRIAIVGYGTAGQACAALLGADGHELTVFEQAPALGPVGAGLLLQPTGLAVLWQLGLLPAVLAHGAPIEGLYGDDTDGRIVLNMRYRALDPQLCGVGIQRGALFALLAAAWPGFATIRRARAIVSVDAERGTLRDAHGERHGPFDLVVVADGAASRLREQVTDSRLNRPYPWGALWCLCPAEGWPHGDSLRQRYRLARKMIGLLPVGTRPDDPTPRLSFFWSLPTNDFAAWAARGLDAWRAELAALWPEADAQLGPLATPTVLARAHYRDTVVRRWYRGRAVLAGDAAHAMSPQLGQGVNMALLDAVALRDSLRAAARVEHALAHYERERRAHVAIYHRWSRWLTPLFQSNADVLARLRNRYFEPLGRLPPGSGVRLRVLAGVQRGWLGRLALPEGFGAALTQARAAGTSRAGRPR